MFDEKKVTLNERQRDAIIKRVRADKVIGRNSLSHIDECYTDQELIDECERFGITGACKAVASFRRAHRLWREREREVRNEIF